MGIITDINEQTRNKGRVNIYIDGEFVCGLDALTAKLNRLKIGEEITQERLDEILLKSEAVAAFDKAAGFIGYRMRSEKEIYKYLEKKGYAGQVIINVIQKLKDYGYINDAEFARQYLNSKLNKSGIRKLAFELKTLGISDAIINELKEEQGGQQPQIEELARKYLKTAKQPDPYKLKNRLAARGFNFEDINAVIARLKSSGAFESGEYGEDY